MSKSCPCHSGKNYRECCKSYHEGLAAPDALRLMRSRYAAYALKKIDYINATAAQKRDKKELALSYQNTQFIGLDILEFIDGQTEAYVTFTAHLLQHSKDISFTEKSFFQKIDGRWIYINGQMIY